MGWLERYWAWRLRRRELHAERQQAALERASARARRTFAPVRDDPPESAMVPEEVEVRWGLPEDE